MENAAPKSNSLSDYELGFSWFKSLTMTRCNLWTETKFLATRLSFMAPRLSRSQINTLAASSSVSHAFQPTCLFPVEYSSSPRSQIGSAILLPSNGSLLSHPSPASYLLRHDQFLNSDSSTLGFAKPHLLFDSEAAGEVGGKGRSLFGSEAAGNVSEDEVSSELNASCSFALRCQRT